MAENIAFAAGLADREPEVGPLLEQAGLDPSFAERDVKELSVGEQQRAMLARTLALEPRVLLLDEPTSALDGEARAAVEATIDRLRSELDASIVLVTHDEAQAERLAGSSILRLERGADRGRRRMTGIEVTLGEVAASLVLVAIAIAISRWRGADLEQDMAIAVLRSFVQLTAAGYVIQFVFDDGSLWFVVALLLISIGFGTLTARSRAKEVPGATLPILIALTLAAVVTIGLVLALGVFDATARYLVPVGAMVVGNSMTACAVALNRLGDEMSSGAAEIEATLALGATSRQAALPHLRSSLRSGTIALIDSTKTTGLIFFPGTMVGALLAGADPVDAVRLQLILLWVLLGAATISALVSTTLVYRNFFTPAHQLRDQPVP